MKNYKIVQVKVIFGDNVKQPIVVFSTTSGIDIARTPKQALLDLQNSGRALSLDPHLFNRGIGSVSVQNLGAFKKELFKTVGAELSGDIKPFKAGDKFTYTEGHPALTDKNHPAYGTAKLGGQGIAEKDGVWVELFLNIPQTQQELLVDSISDKTASLFANMFGMTGSSASQETIDVYDEPTEEETISQEVVGNAKQPK